MNDWRLIGYNGNLIKRALKKIQFPEFWINACNSKNEFYQMVLDDAYAFVSKYKRGYEFLNSNQIGAFWHAHCELCTEEINTEKAMECYCTEDYCIWICEKCFADFKDKFNWTIIGKI